MAADGEALEKRRPLARRAALPVANGRVRRQGLLRLQPFGPAHVPFMTPGLQDPPPLLWCQQRSIVPVAEPRLPEGIGAAHRRVLQDVLHPGMGRVPPDHGVRAMGMARERKRSKILFESPEERLEGVVAPDPVRELHEAPNVPFPRVAEHARARDRQHFMEVAPGRVCPQVLHATSHAIQHEQRKDPSIAIAQPTRQ